jgi:hypothetical protein
MAILALHVTTACAVAQPIPDRSVRPGAGAGEALRVVRADRLEVRAATGFCVITTLDPAVKPIVEASGERLSPERIVALNGITSSNLDRELRTQEAVGQIGKYPGDFRILEAGHIGVDRADCPDRLNDMLVRQRISLGERPEGYRVTLTATRGSKAYEAFIDRPSVIVAGSDARSMIAEDAVTDPVTGKPYWDVHRDVARLSRGFLKHLLGEDVE